MQSYLSRWMLQKGAALEVQFWVHSVYPTCMRACFVHALDVHQWEIKPHDLHSSGGHRSKVITYLISPMKEIKQDTVRMPLKWFLHLNEPCRKLIRACQIKGTATAKALRQKRPLGSKGWEGIQCGWASVSKSMCKEAGEVGKDWGTPGHVSHGKSSHLSKGFFQQGDKKPDHIF